MRKFDKKLFILDLDETLIYATEEVLERNEDFCVGQYFVYKRPFLELLLGFCFGNFNVAVWTTATKSYAEEILRKILKKNQKLQFLWTRDKCTLFYDEEEHEHYFVKRMYKIRRRGYKLKSVIVVDDTPNVWRCSYGNLIRVRKFEGDENDDELKFLSIYLKELLEVRNIRAIEKRNWRMRISQK